jgi:hypothetical protein
MKPSPRNTARSRQRPDRPGASLTLLAALLVFWPGGGRAGTLVLQVAPLHSRTPTGPCPSTISLEETLQPYREGSYGVDGRAALESVATGWRLTGRDAFSATWQATLLPAYRRCLASAGIVRFDNEPFREHSHLRLRFSEGRLQLILDMTGRRDPNGYTPAILRATVSEGQPTWTWSGSD